MTLYALRLQPGEDSKAAMDTLAQTHHLKAASVIDQYVQAILPGDELLGNVADLRLGRQVSQQVLN